MFGHWVKSLLKEGVKVSQRGMWTIDQDRDPSQSFCNLLIYFPDVAIPSSASLMLPLVCTNSS